MFTNSELHYAGIFHPLCPSSEFAVLANWPKIAIHSKLIMHTENHKSEITCYYYAYWIYRTANGRYISNNLNAPYTL